MSITNFYILCLLQYTTYLFHAIVLCKNNLPLDFDYLAMMKRRRMHMKDEWKRLFQIFWTFFKIGPVSYGGGMPLSR